MVVPLRVSIRCFEQCRMVYNEYKQYIINVIFWNLDSSSVILFLKFEFVHLAL